MRNRDIRRGSRHQRWKNLMAGVILTVAVIITSDGIGSGNSPLTAYAETAGAMEETRYTKEKVPEMQDHTPLTRDKKSEIQSSPEKNQEKASEERDKRDGQDEGNIQEGTASRQEKITSVRDRPAQDEPGSEKEEAEEISAGEEEAEATPSPVISCSQKDYEVLKRIVEAEAGICDMKGRILVANVVINRVKSEYFPDTVTDVVYQRSQFSPVRDGRMASCRVSEETAEAVDRALAGEDYSQGALYFMNRERSHSRNVRWFDRNLTYLFYHDHHEFFR